MTTFAADPALGASGPTSASRLLEIINEEVRLFHALLDALQSEQAALVADDLEGIERAGAAKVELVGRAQQAEGERLRLVRQLSEALEVDPERANLERLIAAVDSRHGEELARMRQVLLDLNQKIRRANENNAFLIRQSLRYTSRCLDILTGDPGDRGIYGKFGHTTKRTQGGRSVLNRTA